MFAAIPFVGPYWASFPGVVDLWLVQDQGLAAIGFFLAHMLPSYVVDTAIYSEIKEWVLLILPFVCLFLLPFPAAELEQGPWECLKVVKIWKPSKFQGL